MADEIFCSVLSVEQNVAARCFVIVGRMCNVVSAGRECAETVLLSQNLVLPPPRVSVPPAVKTKDSKPECASLFTRDSFTCNFLPLLKVCMFLSYF